MLARLTYLIIVGFVGVATILLGQRVPTRIVEAATLVTGPAQTLVDTPFDAIGDFFSSLGNLGQLRRENDALRAEADSLRQQAARLAELEQENRTLREQLAFRQTQPEFQMQSAHVVGRDTNPLVEAVTIDQGTSAGLADGMVVVSPAGLVGRIERAGPSASKVLLITASASSVNGVLQESRARGIVEGRPGEMLLLKNLGQDEVVRVGGRVVTSGLGSLFPPGLLIGTITSVRKTDVELYQEARVKPAVDFDHLEVVLVITNFQPARLD